jgi:3-oxoadipate enol-lactonase
MNRFIASDGLEIAYALDDYTNPWQPAQTVILVHAAMGSSIRFYAWVPHLTRHFRVARIDMRGHGATALPDAAALSVERLARDVVELADHLGARQFHVAGSSAGSTVAGKTAIDYADRVLSFGAFACTGGIKHGLQDQNSWVRKIGETGLAAFLRDTIADRVDLKTVEPGFVDWFIAESARTSVAALRRFVPMMRGFDFVADLPGIHCPTLAVAPGGDPIHTLAHYRALPDNIANCEFMVYDGLPHNITDAVPDRCARDYLKFLRKHAGLG